MTVCKAEVLHLLKVSRAPPNLQNQTLRENGGRYVLFFLLYGTNSAKKELTPRQKI